MKSDSNIAIFSTVFCPSIAYLATLRRYKEAVIEAFETFEKQTYRNRTYIQAANGVQPLIIPLKRSHLTKQKTNEIQISYAEAWNRKHWRAICSAYSKSPFFEYFEEEIFPFFSRRYDLLLDLNNEILDFCCRVFAIPAAVSLSRDYVTQYANDYRTVFKVQNQGTEQGFFPPYLQCFSAKLGFCQNLSFLDLLFSLGREGETYLQTIDFQ
ncbi:MAG: WbqC family protein [Bacteroidales bacterium]|jgi:hypothetical protein|nr:WbqC family protein [Bacteroidales bacterium]